MIDLNSDVGEGWGAHPGGPDAELMPYLSSANIACGGHAGDPSTMRRTCELAVRHGVTIGAHVSYPDLVGFGRVFIDMPAAQLTDHVLTQIAALDAMARVVGSGVRYIKPHGALYHAMRHHEAQAAAVVAAVRDWGRLPIVGFPGSIVGTIAAEHGIEFVEEGFADRAYREDGSLVPRSHAGALLTDPDEAARQASALARRGIASICVHSDTPGALAVAAHVHRELVREFGRLQPFAAASR